jgi:DNA transformation protein
VSVSAGFQDYLSDVLAPLGRIETKRVFGLHGIKAGGVLLGFIIEERLYFRTDEKSRDAYIEGGGHPYTFTKHTGEYIVTSYYSLPDQVYDDPEELARWARRARVAALEAPSARKRRSASARRSEEKPGSGRPRT